MLYIDVILPLAFSGQVFTYHCPDDILSPKIGARVKVPFISSVKTAIVTALHNNRPAYKTRALLEVIDQNPIITPEQLGLMRWIADYYICPLGMVLKNTLPTAIRSATYTPPTRLAYALNPHFSLQEIYALISKRKAAQNALSTYLKLQEDENEPYTPTSKKALAEYGATVAGLKFLVDQNILTSTTVEARKYSALTHSSSREVHPMSEKIIANAQRPTLLFNTGNPELLHTILCGVIEQTAIGGKTTLIITPDTFSAATLTDRLHSDFEVVEYHPRISQPKRNEAYMRICNNPETLDIIVGTRAATLLPLFNLGLVIVIEESDFGHKSDQTLPFNSRDVALMLAGQYKAQCLLTTSAPSLEAYTMCRLERWQMIKIEDGDKHNAKVKLLEKGKKMLFSKYMLRRIEETISEQKQVIVFQNRRGFASSLLCEDCGYIPQCQRCNVMLTLHNSDHTMRCHYCGFQIPSPKICPACSSAKIKAQGMGTERVAEELSELFSGARIARVDSDSVARSDAFGELSEDIEDAKADIIVGTQLILRGMRPPKAALAIVVNADNMFLSTDFRTSERALSSLLRLRTMVNGGELIIQSSNTQNPTLKTLEWDQVSNYYKREFDERNELRFPPFVRLIILRLYCNSRAILINAASTLDAQLQTRFGTRASAPYEPAIDKIQNRYILEIILRLERNGTLQGEKDSLKAISDDFRKRFTSVDLVIDVDPV